MIPTESQEQIAFIQWMRCQYPQHRVIAIPNGGLRNIITAARMKREGVAKGIPDLLIPSLKLWIEMKRIKGGSVSPEQKDWMEYLASAGYFCHVCKGAQAAIDVINSYVVRGMSIKVEKINKKSVDTTIN